MIGAGAGPEVRSWGWPCVGGGGDGNDAWVGLSLWSGLRLGRGIEAYGWASGQWFGPGTGV